MSRSDPAPPSPESPGTPPSTGPRWQKWVPQVVLAVIPLALVLPTVGRNTTLYGSDVVTDFYYVFAYVGQSLREGRLPVWDPHTLAGFPLAAAMLAAAYYPFTWISALVPPQFFWPLAAVVHLALAGLFTFAWLRKGLRTSVGAAFLGGLIFMLGGPGLNLLDAGHVAYLMAYAWFPAVIWRTERLIEAPSLRRGLLLSLPIGLLLLTGSPQYAFFAFLLMASRVLLACLSGKDPWKDRWRRVAWVGASAAWGTLLASPQLLTTLELIPQTVRVVGNHYEFITSFSFPPRSLLTLLVPHYFQAAPTSGEGVLYPPVEVRSYVGVASLALAAVALADRQRRHRFYWGGIALGSVLLALGRHTPLYQAVYHLIPGGSLFRAPERFLALLPLAMAPLVAFGFDRTRSGDGPARKISGGVSIGALLLAALLAPAALGGTHGSRLLLPLAWCALVSAFFFAAKASASAGRFAMGIGAVLVLDLLAFARPYFRSYPVDRLDWPPSFVQFVRQHPAYPFRLVSPGDPHPGDIGRCRTSGLEHLGGYEALLLARYAELMNVVHERPSGEAGIFISPGRPHPVLDMLGARIWLVTPPAAPLPDWKPVGGLGAASVFESARALPRAFLVPQAKIIPDKETRLGYLASESFEPRKVVVLEAGTEGEPFDLAPGRVVLRDRAPGSYLLETETAKGAFLVLTEAYFPGWKAEIDGRPAPILRANHVVQAVRLPPGNHTVRFTYRSTFLNAGLVLSALVVALSTAAALRAAFRRR